MNKAKETVPRLRIRITANAERVLRAGHPWLFSESIIEQNREGKSGELAVIYDRKDRFLAMGLFDPDSPIRIRILHTGKPRPINREYWRERLESAIRRRKGLFETDTTGFRWIYGESDAWPGLVLDRYDSTLVLKLYTGAWLTRLDELIRLFEERLGPERIVLRLSRNIQTFAERQFFKKDGEILCGKLLHEPVVFLETGLRFEANVLKGQKTGFFLDQRENRRQVETSARGREVLNAFSFSGAFSIYAARGGARSVTDLDISKHALEGSARNFELNCSIPAVRSCERKLIQADAFDWLSQNARRHFDMIILDPPSMARRESERCGAIHGYHRLALAALKHLRRGGILIACSCSAHVTTTEFFGAMRRAVSSSTHSFVELQTTGHPLDHQPGFKESEYLKAIYFKRLG